MPTPDRFLRDLKELIARFAPEALSPSESRQNSFGFGHACGFFEGLKRAEELYEKTLDQEEQELRGGKNR